MRIYENSELIIAEVFDDTVFSSFMDIEAKN